MLFRGGTYSVLFLLQFLEPTVQHVYPVYPQRAEEMAPAVLQPDPGKVRNGYPSCKPAHKLKVLAAGG